MRYGEGGAEGGDDGLGSGDGGLADEVFEVEALLCGAAHLEGDGFAFDVDFDGEGGVDGDGGGGVEARAVGRDGAHLRGDGGVDGGAGVVAEELADLPLAGEEPEGIADLRLKAALHGCVARLGLYTGPRREGREELDLVNEGLKWHGGSSRRSG